MVAARTIALGSCALMFFACAGCGSGAGTTVVGGSNPPTTTATPVFSPAAGTFATAQSVTITDATAGAAIYYTIDGSAPTTMSTRYSAAIPVTATRTIKAFAVASGDTASAVATVTYTISTGTGGGGTGGNSYSTNFPLTENPIAEAGKWLNGGSDGIDWGDVQTRPGLAFGTVVSGMPPYNDSTAVLTGNWGANQTAQATVSLNNSGDISSQEEVELRLNTTIVANRITGYEFDASVIAGNPYLLIVRWNGALNSFTTISSTVAVAVKNGDVLRATNVNGVLTFYVNGVAKVTATDSTYTGGAPGIGFWNVGGNASELGDYGFSSFTASD